MTRLIKRYGGGSRKLYDTTESRYVSLDEIAAWVRAGERVRIVDSATGDDVTGQTLTQVMLEAEKRGGSILPVDLLHEVIRRGEQALRSGVAQVQDGVESIVRASVDRLPPVREARAEMAELRRRIDELEASLESGTGASARPRRRSTRKTSRR
ncbi:MAG: polyhydroxyalkanoate synthesis regulator DNA-binding domain-containing protein [Gemmatimonadaceae bacterium]|jgi:polyhydroxyalkanoate synthesis repressor PhaR|nr:polyhydroxyalkanoate synthesis regulator DNA-binding domain-containing protein [Gemmatimonadaceae bacterium]